MSACRPQEVLEWLQDRLDSRAQRSRRAKSPSQSKAVLPVIPSSSSKTSHSLRSICALHSRRQAGVVTIYSLPVAARYVEQDGLSGVILDYGLRSQDVAMPYAVT
jgi:hypothetical protein